MRSFGDEATNLGLAPTIQVQFPIVRQTALNLMCRSNDPNASTTTLNGDAMDQESILSKVEGKGQAMTFRDLCTFRLMISYVYRDLDTASKMIDTLSEFPVSNPVIVRSHLRQAFTGLTSFALSREPSLSRKSKKKFLALANNAFNYFKQAVKKGSLNAYPIYRLLLAEKIPSKQNYDEAIRVCCRSGCKNFEAIAFECCGLWFADQRDDYWSSFYLSHAAERYLEWGAIGKADALHTTFPFLEATGDISSLGTNFRGKRVHRDYVMENTKSLRFEDFEILESDAGET